MLAALPIACVQTPPPLSKNRRRAPSPIFTEGRGVCTQATLPIHLFLPYFRSITSNSRHLELFPWKVRLIGSRLYFFTF